MAWAGCCPGAVKGLLGVRGRFCRIVKDRFDRVDRVDRILHDKCLEPRMSGRRPLRGAFQAVAITQVPLLRVNPRTSSRRRFSAATRWCSQ